MTAAFVGLGANLGDREATLRTAISLLREVDGVEVTGVSSFRDTDPVGYLDQPRFLNGAVALETTLAPAKLLEALLAIERELGRRRRARGSVRGRSISTCSSSRAWSSTSRV